jgi:hypothetical protein
MSYKRLLAFERLSEHPWFNKVYKKLSASERWACRDFIIRNAKADPHEFESAINRWFLDNNQKPKNWTSMMELTGAAAREAAKKED